jgi:DNA-binding Xre family transcriptional regulator
VNRPSSEQHKTHKENLERKPGLFNQRGICWLVPRSNAPFIVRPGVSGDLGSVAEYHASTTGSRVYARRVALGMTQEELERRTGLKPTAISHFECGRRKPCLKNLLLLCGALECSPNDLLLGANNSDQKHFCAVRQEHYGPQICGFRTGRRVHECCF